MASTVSVLRILLVEDDQFRVGTIQQWLPRTITREGRPVPVVLVHASSAGLALGLVARARPGEWAGILLDHDLEGGGAHERGPRAKRA